MQMIPLLCSLLRELNDYFTHQWNQIVHDFTINSTKTVFRPEGYPVDGVSSASANAAFHRYHILLFPLQLNRSTLKLAANTTETVCRSPVQRDTLSLEIMCLSVMLMESTHHYKLVSIG